MLILVYRPILVLSLSTKCIDNVTAVLCGRLLIEVDMLLVMSRINTLLQVLGYKLLLSKARISSQCK